MGNEASQYGKKIENNVKVKWEKEKVVCPYVPREGQACAVINSKIYFFGGVTLLPESELTDESVTESNELIVFDTILKQWSKEPTKDIWPGQRSGATMVAVKQCLYLFGGLSQLTGWLNDMFVYDTDTKVWREITAVNCPSPRDKVSAVAVRSKIYIFGGFGPVLEPDPSDILPDDDDDEYEDIDELQEVRNCQDAANFTWSNQLYVFDIENETWSVVSVNNDMAPSPRAAHTLSYIKDKSGSDGLYVFGGRDAQSRRNDLWKFDIDKTQWDECKCLGCAPEPRSFHATSSAGCRLFTFGGRGMKDQHFNDLNIYDTETKEWLQPSALSGGENASGDALVPPAVGLHSLCTTDKSLVLFGGSSDLDPATGTCMNVFNDIYFASIEQLLDGGSVKNSNGTTEEKSDKPAIPGLVDLKPNSSAESNGSNT